MCGCAGFWPVDTREVEADVVKAIMGMFLFCFILFFLCTDWSVLLWVCCIAFNLYMNVIRLQRTEHLEK